ncbi:hypothetical protein FQA39_LY18498 [Lamprigera yunnana]|nr:hypothetical protein FQA39_LY18498 [Lamprigera yunnana]
MANWTRAIVSNLIYIYKSHECLWKVDINDYKNKSLRLEAWSAIANQLNAESKINVAPADIQKKINGLRTNFMKELKLLEGSKRSGGGEQDGIDSIYYPSWWAFYIMSFLKDYVKPITIGRSNLQLENQIAQTADVNNIMEFIDSEGNELHNYVLENGGTISPVSIHTPTTSSDSTATNTNFRVKRLRKSNINNEVALKLMEEARDQLVSMNTATTSTYDSFEIFGATVASELRLLKTPMLIRKAKKEILSAIQSCQEEEENNEI